MIRQIIRLQYHNWNLPFGLLLILNVTFFLFGDLWPEALALATNGRRKGIGTIWPGRGREKLFEFRRIYNDEYFALPR